MIRMYSVLCWQGNQTPWETWNMIVKLCLLNRNSRNDGRQFKACGQVGLFYEFVFLRAIRNRKNVFCTSCFQSLITQQLVRFRIICRTPETISYTLAFLFDQNSSRKKNQEAVVFKLIRICSILYLSILDKLDTNEWL